VSRCIGACLEEDCRAAAPTRIEIHDGTCSHPPGVFLGKSSRTPEADLLAIGEDNDHGTRWRIRQECTDALERTGNTHAIVTRARTAWHTIPVSPEHREWSVGGVTPWNFDQNVVHLDGASVPASCEESVGRWQHAKFAQSIKQPISRCAVSRPAHRARGSISDEAHEFSVRTLRTEACGIGVIRWSRWG